MGIEEIVNINISIEDAAVARAGFGVGLILGSSGKLTSKVQEFADAPAVAAVFSAGDPELVMANAYFGQEIQPEKVFIGQRDVNVKQKSKITIPLLANATLYTLTLNGTGYDFTSDADATRAEIVDGLILAVGSSEPVAFTDNGDDFDIEALVAGIPFTTVVTANLSVTALTANKSISTELAAIEQLNSEWYELLSASHLDVDIKEAAAFIQARRLSYSTSTQNPDVVDSEAEQKLLTFDADFITANLIDMNIDGIPITQVPFNTDQPTTMTDLATQIALSTKVATATVTGAREITIVMAVLDVIVPITGILVTAGASQAGGTVATIVDPTTDLGAELKALNLDRTQVMYLPTADTEYPEAAWSGRVLPADPGSITWAFQTLALVTVSKLTAPQKSKALANNLNTYVVIAGIAVTQNGTKSSGRFIDVRRGIDWLQARMEEAIFFQIANLPKIPYTDIGTSVIESEMRGVLSLGTRRQLIAQEPEPTITIPKVATVAVNDRAARLLPDVKFTATLSGAIHKVTINGTVSV